MDQQELIVQLQQGNESAFVRLVDEWQDMVYNTALGIVQNAEDADDIAQEVFIQIFQSIRSFKGDAKLSTWIYRITITKSLDHEKRKKRKKRFAFVQSLFGDGNEEEAQPAEFNHPGVQMENKEKATGLLQAIDRLPEKQKVAFVLHKLEGQSHREIAEIMKTSLVSVESLIARAKTNLRKLLTEYYKDKIIEPEKDPL